MNKIMLIIKREYSSRVKKKSFIIMTLLGPLLFAGLMAGAIFITQADTQESRILIVDEPGLITHFSEEHQQFVPNCLDCYTENKNYVYRFTNERLADSTFINGDYTLMVVVDEAIYEHHQPTLFYKKVPGMNVTQQIERDLEKAAERAKIQNEGLLDYETYKRMKVDLSLNKLNIVDGENKFEQERAGVGMVFAVIIFFFIFVFGAYVMRGVIEEKTSRIIEVIVSSVRPFELMMGKIIGIALVAITQFLIWVVFSMLIFFVAGSLFESGAFEQAASMQQQLPQNADFATYLAQQEGFQLLVAINWPLMLSMFLLYFVGGYLLYASLFAAIGAAVDSETDTQQFMMPIMMPLFFSYFLAILSVNNPEGTAAYIASFVPFTSPTVMMVRVAVGNVPVWELILSLALLAGTVVALTWLAGKVYRVGILMYGKRPSYKEIWKWIFYKA
ncbi:MAG: ABC transporter permease [Flavobacteriales bacterium]|nr:ABC transporter permease [Flavobacteriales bacterium]